MSRLDSFIRRMSAQRDCLNWVAKSLSELSGPVLELGLGNGRTYDHLRSLMPQRNIYVFDRQIAAHPDCIPDKNHMFLGEITETLPLALNQLGLNSCALIHTDIGTGNAATNAELAKSIAPFLNQLTKKGGYVISDQDLPLKGFEQIPVPVGVPEGRYMINRKTS